MKIVTFFDSYLIRTPLTLIEYLLVFKILQKIMSIFKQVISSSKKVVNVCIEDGKMFAGHAFMIITTDAKQNLYIVSPVNEKKQATFFASVIKPREDCRTLAKLAILRLRENSRNLFSLEGLSLNLFEDVPMPHLGGLLCRIYFLKIPCIHRAIFQKKDKINAAHWSGSFSIPDEWMATNTITLLPINFINFDILGSCLVDIDRTEIGLEKLQSRFLKASRNTIVKMCADPKIITPCSIRIHASKSWTNETACYYYKL